MKSLRLNLLVFGLVTLGTIASTAQAGVVYRETFENDTGEDRSLSEVGWRLLSGENAEDYTKYQPINRVPGRNFRGGSNRNLEGVNNDPTSEDFNEGYLQEAFGKDWNRVALYYTDEYIHDPQSNPIDSIKWLQGAGENPVKVAIRVGDDEWFVSKESFIGGDNPFYLPTGGETFLLHFPTAKWLELEVVRNKSMLLGEEAELPEGEITAFGWYLPEGKKDKSSVAFDDFTINAATGD